MNQFMHADPADLSWSQLNVYFQHAATLAQTARGDTWWKTHKNRQKMRRRRDALGDEIRRRPLDQQLTDEQIASNTYVIGMMERHLGVGRDELSFTEQDFTTAIRELPAAEYARNRHHILNFTTRRYTP